MAFEAAFGVTTVIAMILFLAYYRLRKKYDEVSRECNRLSTALAVKTEDLPALARNATDPILEPLNEVMGELRERMEKIGGQYAENRQMTNDLIKNTKDISDVLTSSQKRGQYSEITIERVLQMSGFEKGKHYNTQYATETGRADFVVHLPDNRNIILDSKAPLDSLRKSVAAEDEADKSHYMDEHVKAVKGHIKQLSGKQYWKGSESLECVILVMPEYALLPALERDSKLTEYAWGNKVVLATQSILMVLLRAIDIIWKQNEMVDTVKNIGELSADLHAKLVIFGKHYIKIGDNLGKAVNYYNKGVGSWDTRLMPATKKLAQAGAAIDELPEAESIDTVPRRLTSVD